MRRYCLTLDLKNDPTLIAEYRKYHEHVWPEVVDHLKSAGVESLEIYLHGNRLCMVLEVAEDFSWESLRAAERENPKIREWEALMGQFQQPLATARPGDKWMLMERIFRLGESDQAS